MALSRLRGKDLIVVAGWRLKIAQVSHSVLCPGTRRLKNAANIDDFMNEKTEQTVGSNN